MCTSTTSPSACAGTRCHKCSTSKCGACRDGTRAALLQQQRPQPVVVPQLTADTVALHTCLQEFYQEKHRWMGVTHIDSLACTKECNTQAKEKGAESTHVCSAVPEFLSSSEAASA
jgi:hypothetical protein